MMTPGHHPMNDRPTRSRVWPAYKAVRRISAPSIVRVGVAIGLTLLVHTALVCAEEKDAWRQQHDEGFGALRRGRAADAEVAFRRALTLLAPNDWRRVQELQLIGETVYAQRRTAEAEALYREAVALAERLAPPDGARVLVPLTTLGAFFVAERRYAEAHGTYTRAWDISREAFGASDARTAVPLGTLAEIDLIRGDLAAAESRYRMLLALSRAARVAPDDVLRKLDLAWVLRARGRSSEAQELEESVRQVFRSNGKRWAAALAASLRVYEAMVGPGHPLLAVTLRQLATLSVAEDRPVEAQRTYESILTLLDRNGLGDSLLMAAALESYEDVLTRNHQEGQARIVLARAASIREKHRKQHRQ